MRNRVSPRRGRNFEERAEDEPGEAQRSDAPKPERALSGVCPGKRKDAKRAYNSDYKGREALKLVTDIAVNLPLYYEEKAENPGGGGLGGAI